MPQALIITFDRLSEAGFQAKAGAIVGSLTGNSHFPEPWHNQAPTLQQLTTAMNTYRSAYNAALTRDQVKIAQRNTARQALTELLRRLATYLELAANGDAAKLTSTGYDLRREPVRSNGSGTLPAPTDLRVTPGRSGQLTLRLARLAGAAAYEVQTSRAAPDQEDAWVHATTAASAQRVTLEGLTPGATWLRLRGVATRGPGAWCEPVNVTVP